MNRHIPLIVAAVIGWTSAARAEVMRVDITKRADIGLSGYEKVAGTVHFSVDPNSPRNAVVVDLDKAPRAASGRVEFSSGRLHDPAQGSECGGTAPSSGGAESRRPQR